MKILRIIGLAALLMVGASSASAQVYYDMVQMTSQSGYRSEIYETVTTADFLRAPANGVQRLAFTRGSAFTATVYACETKTYAAGTCTSVATLSSTNQSIEITTGRMWLIVDVTAAETAGNVSYLTIRSHSTQQLSGGESATSGAFIVGDTRTQISDIDALSKLFATNAPVSQTMQDALYCAYETDGSDTLCDNVTRVGNFAQLDACLATVANNDPEVCWMAYSIIGSFATSVPAIDTSDYWDNANRNEAALACATTDTRLVWNFTGAGEPTQVVDFHLKMGTDSVSSAHGSGVTIVNCSISDQRRGEDIGYTRLLTGATAAAGGNSLSVVIDGGYDTSVVDYTAGDAGLHYIILRGEDGVAREYGQINDATPPTGCTGSICTTIALTSAAMKPFAVPPVAGDSIEIVKSATQELIPYKRGSTSNSPFLNMDAAKRHYLALLRAKIQQNAFGSSSIGTGMNPEGTATAYIFNSDIAGRIAIDLKARSTTDNDDLISFMEDSTISSRVSGSFFGDRTLKVTSGMNVLSTNNLYQGGRVGSSETGTAYPGTYFKSRGDTFRKIDHSDLFSWTSESHFDVQDALFSEILLSTRIATIIVGDGYDFTIQGRWVGCNFPDNGFDQTNSQANNLYVNISTSPECDVSGMNHFANVRTENNFDNETSPFSRGFVRFGNETATWIGGVRAPATLATYNTNIAESLPTSEIVTVPVKATSVATTLNTGNLICLKIKGLDCFDVSNTSGVVSTCAAAITATEAVTAQCINSAF